MKLSGNDNDKIRPEATPAAASSVEPESETAVCGPGCDCGPPSGNTRTKAVVSLIVLLAVGGILAYKASTAKENASNDLSAEKASVFAMAQAAPEGALEESTQSSTGMKPKEAGRNTNSEAQPNVKSSLEAPAPRAASGESVTAAQPKRQIGQKAQAAKDGRKIGKYLESLSELNEVALNQDTVFIFIPAKKDEAASETTRTAVLSAQKMLNSKGIRVGLYTLQTTSPDFSAMSSQVQVPAILVACKGRGMGAVSGEVTETKLLQAFMASSRAGGCCPSGGSSSGCK